MRKQGRLALLGFAICVAHGAHAGSAVHTICDLAANPSKYANQVVHVEAIFYTDMLERSGLLDPRCRSVQINLYDGPKGPYQDTIDKLNNAEGERHFAGRPVILNLEFSAVFRLVPEAGELPFSKGEQGRLHLTRVWKYSWLSHLPPRR